jgi:hypothetical protein
MDDIIRNIVSTSQDISEIIFIMDNHSTQKNAAVFGYLEYLAKIQVIPKTGKKNYYLF